MLKLNDSSRITTIDFFAVLPSGAYTFLYFASCQEILFDANAKSLWQHVKPVFIDIATDPILLIPSLIVIFLFGSLIRSISVSWIEALVTKKDQFPYPEELKQFLKALRSVRCAKKLLKDLRKTSKPEFLFNYWKDRLCLESESGYGYYLHFEARSRFFSGMFCGGIVGVFLSVYMATLSNNLFAPPVWQAMALSIVISVLFGVQLKNVRKTEARVCVGLYAALCEQSQKAETRDDSRKAT